MGNSPPTGGIRVANSDYSCVANITPSVSVEFGGRKVEQRGEGESTESWEMQYNLGTTNCYFKLSKSSKNSMSSHTPLDEELQITIKHSIYRCFAVSLQSGEDGLLNYKGRCGIFERELPNCTVNANGEITVTNFYLCRYGDCRNLVVSENKRRSADKNPYTVTVMYYSVNTEDGNDFGLSVAVKNIRVSPNGNFHFFVDGPEKHPKSALLYMIDEVRRTKTWKPTFCHHCADNIIQWQRAGDSEDSDIEQVLATLGNRPRLDTGSLLVNNGRFRGGNNNGNLNIRNFIHRGR